MTHNINPDCPYSVEEIRAAFKRTVEFFREHPRKWTKGGMSDRGNPFAKKATCWCFAGRMAVELGPLPKDYVKKKFYDESYHYEPGYAELGSIAHLFDHKVFTTNDKQSNPGRVIVQETLLFAQYDLVPVDMLA
jgi:hypothetical protein